MTTEKKFNILLAEDDPNFGAVLKNYLELHDFQVSLFADGEAGATGFYKGGYDLCILDVMMPKKDGFSLARDIRAHDKDIPVIFLTARSMKDDIMTGFNTGADDYIVKPFDSEVLLMKLQAILKRTTGYENGFNPQDFPVGAYQFNYELRTIKHGLKENHLSPKEADLLKMLCMHLNEVLPRQKALKAIWGDDNYFNARSMDVFITKLRKYLKDDPDIDIMNIHGKGFRMTVK
jgi:two-component system OmpR family response regulator